eukprot:366451-Chlamydomonas_euryale.AAC.11
MLHLVAAGKALQVVCHLLHRVFHRADACSGAAARADECVEHRVRVLAAVVQHFRDPTTAAEHRGAARHAAASGRSPALEAGVAQDAAGAGAPRRAVVAHARQAAVARTHAERRRRQRAGRQRRCASAEIHTKHQPRRAAALDQLLHLLRFNLLLDHLDERGAALLLVVRRLQLDEALERALTHHARRVGERGHRRHEV